MSNNQPALSAVSKRGKGFQALFLFVVLTLLASCKPSVPSQYIQPDDMEDLLYDYHIARAMSQETGSTNLITYNTAILKKYGYTEAQVDSSMAWYLRHTKYLQTIYEHLADRLSKEAMAEGASASDVSRYGADNARGDTVSIWRGQHALVLMPDKPFNLSTFTIKADTAFHKGDRIMLSVQSQFIYQEGMHDGVVVMAVRFANDSVACQTTHISVSGSSSLVIADNAHLGIKEVRGYFMLNDHSGNATSMRIMFLTGINILRIHEPKMTDCAAPGSAGSPAAGSSADSAKAPTPSAPMPTPSAASVDVRPVQRQLRMN